jgi:proclavaminate amidinohydrolase
MFVVRVPGINNEKGTSGCQTAGNFILKKLKKGINEKGKVVDIRRISLEEIHLDNSNLKLTNELIYKNSFEMFEEHPKTIFLGGDHSISYSIARAFFDYCQNSGKNPCLIVFDAHPDIKNSEKNGFPTNRGWLKRIIDEGFPCENILLAGVREIDEEEMDLIKEKKIKFISPTQFFLNIEDTCDSIMEFSNGKELYVSLDIDVADPVFAKGVEFPSPGGFSSRELIYLLQRINMIKKLRGVDIVEVNPENDAEEKTAELAAKILAEL